MSGQQHLSLHRLSLRPAHTGTNGSSDEAGTDVDADVLGPDELLRYMDSVNDDEGGFVRLLETDFIKRVVRMAIGPASLYTGTVAMPRGKYFDILTEFLRLSTEGAAEAKDAKDVEIIKKLSTVATHMLDHTSELLALYNGGTTNHLKEALVRFMSAAAHHESLLNAIIDTNGFLDAMANDFRSNSDYSADLCEVFVAIAKQRPGLLNKDVFSVDIYKALLSKIRSKMAYSDDKLHEAYLGLLTAFWKDNTERVEAFRSTASSTFKRDVLAQYASIVEDEAHLPVLKLLAADGNAWRWFSDVARGDTTNSLWNLSKIADALKDPAVLLGAATSERPEPLATYMLMAVRELDAEKDGANATWWKEAWEKLDKAFEGDVMHGELIANVLHAPLRGFMYKETEKRFEVGKEKNDSGPADERQKRPRTGIGQFRTLLELTRDRLLDHP